MNNFTNKLTQLSKTAREKSLQEVYTTFRYLNSLKPLIVEKLKTELLNRASSGCTDLPLNTYELRKLVPELELIPNLHVYNKAILKIVTWSLQDLGLLVDNTKTTIYVSW